ncbi:MAG: hypothetical protein RR224_01090 [Clostridia bacterium]
MIKRTVKETIREYDGNYKLLKETITETTEDDDTAYFPAFTPYPYTPARSPEPWYAEPTCTCQASGCKQ